MDICDHRRMVLEHAVLSVKPGQGDDFEASFAQAKTIIEGMAGFGRLTLSRCLERSGTYLLLVEWDRLEDHIVGFRGSAQYQQWGSSYTTSTNPSLPSSTTSSCSALDEVAPGGDRVTMTAGGTRGGCRTGRARIPAEAREVAVALGRLPTRPNPIGFGCPSPIWMLPGFPGQDDRVVDAFTRRDRPVRSGIGAPARTRAEVTCTRRHPGRSSVRALIRPRTTCGVSANCGRSRFAGVTAMPPAAPGCVGGAPEWRARRPHRWWRRETTAEAARRAPTRRSGWC